MTATLNTELGCPQLAAVFFEAFHEQAFSVCKGPVVLEVVGPDGGQKPLQTWSVVYDRLKDD